MVVTYLTLFLVLFCITALLFKYRKSLNLNFVYYGIKTLFFVALFILLIPLIVLTEGALAEGLHAFVYTGTSNKTEEQKKSRIKFYYKFILVILTISAIIGSIYFCNYYLV